MNVLAFGAQLLHYMLASCSNQEYLNSFFDTLFRRHQTIQTLSDVFLFEKQRKLPVLFKMQACRAFLLTARASASDQLVVFHAASVEARRPQSYASAAASMIEFRMHCFLQLTFFWLTHCTVDLLTQQVRNNWTALRGTYSKWFLTNTWEACICNI